MKILILGGDGYLGWPTAMHFACLGHDVTVADNYMRRKMSEATESHPLFEIPNLSERCRIFKEIFSQNINVRIGDLADPDFMFSVVKEVVPDTIVHYAEQPSSPYSMRGFNEARETLNNNLNVTFNCLQAMIEFVPDAHLVKLGTMGEYGTPNIDITEGWIEIEKNGRSDKFLYPRAAGSLYHTTKVLDTDLIWFYVRINDLRVTDLMQGPVYGLATEQSVVDDRLLPIFNYDDVFGTVINRFLVQSVAGIPLTVYGAGGQTRGYLNLKDTLKCVQLAAENPSTHGELKIFNQITETFTVNDIALKVQAAAKSLGISVKIKSIPNPRKEKENHYYNPEYSGLVQLGLEPNYMTQDVLQEMLTKVKDRQTNIRNNQIMPRVSWS